jgi:hypothetical protein
VGIASLALPNTPPEIKEIAASRVIGILQKPPEWRGLGVYLDLRLLSVDAQPWQGRARLTEFLGRT